MHLLKRSLTSFLAIALLAVAGFSQQQGSVTGQVQDTLGAALVGASVTVVSPDGRVRNATTNQRGEFTVTGLAPGIYTVRVAIANFAIYENNEVEITAGQRTELLVPLTVEGVDEQVDIDTANQVSTDPNSNLSATVLKGADLEALPDDPDELEAALQALAGPSAGPNGGQIYIDGFTGGRLPPREAIREIRINQNPFSAEYDRLGFGRIEILTRPGADKFRGSAFTNFNDSRFNSRNPFALNRAPGQTRFFGGNVSGPVQKGKSSFFVDINNRDIDANTIINAQVLDANLNVVPFQQDVQVPTRRFSFSPRFDYQINDKNTLQLRYSYTNAKSENQGLGNITLPTRAFETTYTENEIRLTETMIINPTTINETRFEIDFENREQTGDNTIPTINVGSAFVGGGSQIGLSFDKETSWELQNYTTTSLGKNSEHAIKFGVRVRSLTIRDRSENNFGGSFSFINLDSYRNTVLGNDYPTSFSLTTGNPEQKVSRTDVGLFITDDWRISPGFTMSFGLRYENQTNIKDNLNFAPRVSFAWSPGAGGARAPKTVIRGGFGLFYDRFSENLTLQAQRFNGSNQLSLLVNSFDPDPVRRAAAIALLQQAVFTVDGVTNVPTAAQIQAALPQSNTIRTISPEIQSPYLAQVALGVERQLPRNTTLSVFYIGSRTWHVLRARNINAPICPEQVNCLDAPRPNPSAGDIYQYESSGILNQNRININLRSNLNPRISIWGNYSLGFSKSNSDGAQSFPAYTYDLSDEYGRSSFDTRHSVVFGGNVSLPWSFSLNPFVTANTGSPFNITRGVDLNGDGLTNERPTFGELATRCGELGLTNSFCDVSGFDPNEIIPRNFADGQKFFNVNLRVSKNFGFGKTAAPAGDAPQAGGGPRGGGIPGIGRGGPRGGGPGGFGGMGGGDGRSPYNLNVSVQFTNLLNTVNFASPISNLASSRIGQFTRTQGGFGGFGGFGGSGSNNRSITLQARFSW
ncbi:MAG: TonB-dependent receptor [Acidobacteria bacterium]|nr:TonB-dependent receptor [Acidobacteriota bacterium]